MDPKKTFILAIVLAILALFVFFWDMPTKKKKQAEEMTTDKLVEIAFDDVTQIKLVKGVQTAAFEKRDEHWYLTQPVEDIADRWAVQALISAFRYARPTRTLEDLPEDYGQRFGLDKPSHMLTLTAGEETKTIITGYTHQIGNSIYVQVEGTDKVHLISAGSISALDKSVHDMRRRELLSPMDADKKVRRVQIEMAGQPPLLLIAEEPPEPETEGEEERQQKPKALPEDLPWHIGAPTGPVADKEMMKGILDKLSAVRVADFEEQTEEGLETYGLDQPSLTISAIFGDGDNPLTLTLRVGKKVEPGVRYYAMVDDRPFVVTVRDEHLEPFRVTRKELRDHRLLPDLDMGQVAMIDLQSADGSFRISRSGDGWAFADESPVDGSLIDKMLEEAAKWRANNLVDDARYNRLRRTVRGKKVTTLTFYNADAQVIERLRFSEPVDPEKIAPVKKRRQATQEDEETEPAEKQVVVLVDGGYNRTVYLTDPAVLDDIPTDAENLRLPVEQEEAADTENTAAESDEAAPPDDVPSTEQENEEEVED